MNNYKIRTIEVQNIRNIDSAKLNLEDKEGIIRVGGRNGQGKSTAFQIGLSALLGLTPAKPLLKKNERMGFYRVTNGLGEFSFMVHQTEGVHFSYNLKNGDKGRSKDTINHNPCIPIIRAYMGFNIDEEFNNALNLNSGGELKFIVTNGRSNLGFVKDLVYSEEIERIQSVATEDIKNGKEALKAIGDKVLFLNGQYNDIKTVNQEQLEQLEQRLTITENNLIVVGKLQTGITNITKKVRDREKEALYLFRAKVKLIQRLIKEYKKVNWEVNIGGAVNLKIDKVLNGKIALVGKQRQILKLMDITGLGALKLNIANHIPRLPLYNLKGSKVQLTQKQVSLVNAIDGETTPIKVKEDLMGYKKKQIEILKETKQELGNQIIRVKNSKLRYIKSNQLLMEQIVGFFTKFLLSTTEYPRIFLSQFSTLLEGVNQRKQDIEVVSEDIDRQKEELNEEIFREGRCILCNSKKS